MHSLPQKVRVIFRLLLNSRSFFWGGWILAFVWSFIWRLSHSELKVLTTSGLRFKKNFFKNWTKYFYENLDIEKNVSCSETTTSFIAKIKKLKILIPYSGDEDAFYKEGFDNVVNFNFCQLVVKPFL